MKGLNSDEFQKRILGSSQTSMVVPYGLKSLSIFTKSFIIDVSKGSKYASEFCHKYFVVRYFGLNAFKVS